MYYCINGSGCHSVILTKLMRLTAPAAAVLLAGYENETKMHPAHSGDDLLQLHANKVSLPRPLQKVIFGPSLWRSQRLLLYNLNS